MRMYCAVVIGTMGLTSLHATAQTTKPQVAQRGTGDEAAAAQIIEQVRQAYRDAPGLKDSMTLTKTVAGSSMSIEMAVDFRPGTDAELSYDHYRIAAAGEALFVSSTRAPNKYFKRPLHEDVQQTLLQLEGGFIPPMPHIQWRIASQDNEPAAALNLTMPLGLKPTDHALVERDGRQVIEVKLTGQNSTAVATISPRTMLLQSLVITYLIYGSPAASAETYTLQCSPELLESPEPLIVVTEGRRVVESLAQLVPFGVGDRLEKVQFARLDGSTVKIEDYRGSVVVLDLWATWCGPCRAAMPVLDEFTREAKEAGKPIVVLAVNTNEFQGRRVENAEARRLANIRGYWETVDYAFEPVIDSADALIDQFGFQSIPAMVIVGPDGVIRNTHTGFPGAEGYLQTLRSETADAIKAER